MAQVVIENPILNSPFEKPTRHFRFTEDGITDEIEPGRRVSSYFIPTPCAKKKNPKQLGFEAEWTADRIKPNDFINKVRERLALWRPGGYPGLTRTSAALLDYWKRPDRERRLFFCQIEALETLVYVTGVAGRYGDAWIENELRQQNAGANCVGTIMLQGDNIQFPGATCGAATQSNPLLGTLADHGGDTLTVDLLAGSVAIDLAGPTYCPSTDQRGDQRPLGAACDLGAFERWAELFLPLVRR